MLALLDASGWVDSATPAQPSAADQSQDRLSAQKIWLPFLDAYRTMCVAPQPEFRRLLEGIREMKLAERDVARAASAFD
jgi:hypothetical protein